MNKKAQEVMGMSFGVIFSIFLIIFLVATAIYAISYFYNLGNCSKVGLFYKDLQNEIDQAWKVDIYEGLFGSNSEIPSSIKYVCFGNLSQNINPDNEKQKEDIDLFYSGNGQANIFILPEEKACEGSLASNILNHVETDKFFCVEPIKSKISIRLRNEPEFAKVKLATP